MSDRQYIDIQMDYSRDPWYTEDPPSDDYEQNPDVDWDQHTTSTDINDHDLYAQVFPQFDTLFHYEDETRKAPRERPEAVNTDTDFDGPLKGEAPYAIHQDIRDRGWNRPLRLEDLNKSEIYDKFHEANLRLVKKANVVRGDWVILINTRHHPNIPKGWNDRIGFLQEDCKNGWYIFKAINGNQYAVYNGPSIWDLSFEKIDWDTMEEAKTAATNEDRLVRILEGLSQNIYEDDPDGRPETIVDFMEQNNIEDNIQERESRVPFNVI